MEEAAQILEVETFIPFLLQKNEDGISRLKVIIPSLSYHLYLFSLVLELGFFLKKNIPNQSALSVLGITISYRQWWKIWPFNDMAIWNSPYLPDLFAWGFPQ